MARMIPPQFLDINGSPAEGRVFAALARLPDEVVVFHSRSWQDRSGSRVEEGEADFVIVDPDAGVLVAEVKGGAIELRDGAWYQGGRGQPATDRIDPAGQARRSMHVLRRLIDARIGAKTVLFGQFVWFPDVAWTGETPLDCPPLLDSGHIEDPAAAIALVYAYWKKGRSAKGGGGAPITQALIDLLAPTLRVEPAPLRTDIVETASVLVPMSVRPVSAARDRYEAMKAFGWSTLVVLGRLARDGLRWLALLPVKFIAMVLSVLAGILLAVGHAGWRGWRAAVNFAVGGGLIGAAVGTVAYFGFHAERAPAWIGGGLGLAFVAFVLNALNQGLETQAARIRSIVARRVADLSI